MGTVAASKSSEARSLVSAPWQSIDLAAASMNFSVVEVGAIDGFGRTDVSLARLSEPLLGRAFL
jgi:hypothetical protein